MDVTMYDIEKINAILDNETHAANIVKLNSVEEFKNYLGENGVDLSVEETQELVNDLASAEEDGELDLDDLGDVAGGRGPQQGGPRPQPGRQQPGKQQQPGKPGRQQPGKQQPQPGRPGGQQPGGVHVTKRGGDLGGRFTSWKR
jgi:hypothetical protein